MLWSDVRVPRGRPPNLRAPESQPAAPTLTPCSAGLYASLLLPVQVPCPRPAVQGGGDCGAAGGTVPWAHRLSSPLAFILQGDILRPGHNFYRASVIALDRSFVVSCHVPAGDTESRNNVLCSFCCLTAPTVFGERLPWKQSSVVRHGLDDGRDFGWRSVPLKGCGLSWSVQGDTLNQSAQDPRSPGRGG